MTSSGLHHVTAIASSAKRNLTFYTRILGLRLVKRTVNFDDPSAYHFYYGDETGQPGSIVTFFALENAAAGRLGAGEAQETVLRIPESALAFWVQRFVEKGVAHDAVMKRFGETVLAFSDPDGVRLALAAIPGIESEPGWCQGDVPEEAAIRGIHGGGCLLATLLGRVHFYPMFSALLRQGTKVPSSVSRRPEAGSEELWTCMPLGLFRRQELAPDPSIMLLSGRLMMNVRRQW